MRKLQFETEDSSHGLTKSSGFVWADQKGIHIEYQVSDNIIEIYKSDISEVFIPYAQVGDITYKSSWLNGGKVLVQLNSLKNTDKIPFLKDAVLSISLKRKNKDQGKDFAVDSKIELSNYRLNELG